jgi:hypothetical protein
MPGQQEGATDAQLHELERQRVAGEITEIGYHLQRNRLIIQEEQQARGAVAGQLVASSSSPSAAPPSRQPPPFPQPYLAHQLQGLPPQPYRYGPDAPFGLQRSTILLAVQGLVIIQGVLALITAINVFRLAVAIDSITSVITLPGSTGSAVPIFGVGVLIVAFLLIIAGIRVGHPSSSARLLLAIWEIAAFLITLLFVAGGQDLGWLTVFLLLTGGFPLVDIGIVLAVEALVILGLVIHPAAYRAVSG